MFVRMETEQSVLFDGIVVVDFEYWMSLFCLLVSGV